MFIVKDYFSHFYWLVQRKKQLWKNVIDHLKITGKM